MLVLLLVVLACTCWCYWKKRHVFRLASAIPNMNAGFLGLHLVGKTVQECFNLLLKYNEELGDGIGKGWFAHYLVVGVSNPAYLEIIMSSKLVSDRGHVVKFMSPIMGDGIFTASVDIWKKHRKLVTPAFSQKLLNSYLPIFSEKCDILIENLEKHVGEKDIHITELLSNYAADTICKTAFGTTVEVQTTENNIYGALHGFLEIFMRRLFNPFYHFDIIFNLSKLGRLSNKVGKELTNLTQKIVSQQKEVFEQKIHGIYTLEQDDNQYKCLLDMLLEESYKNVQFTEQQVMDEVATILYSGSHTTAIASSYCFLTLALYPDFQQKVYDEALEVLSEDRCATKEDLSKLKFTEMFIKETMRIFPIVPFILRMATGDVRINDKVVIPKDSLIVFGMQHLHRNPKYWKDPLKFDPERFLPENFAKQHPFSYLPFAGGPRNCIGSRYAMMNMKLLLSRIVRKFILKTDYKSVEDVDLSLNFLSYPSNGYKISLELRK